MARFESIGDTMVNVDRIIAWHRVVTDPDTLIVELDNGEILKARDTRHWLEEELEGRDFITQVIPCTKPLYARYKEDDGKEYDYPVHFLGLCADGYVRPLDVRDSENIGFADEACNYVGLYEEALHHD